MDKLELLHPLVAKALAQYAVQGKAMECDPALADTAAFCEHYNFKPDQTCNAILAASKTEPILFACCVVLANCKLDVNKTVCRLLSVKKCSFASAEQTVEITQMEIGGVTPLGIANMQIFVDSRVMENSIIVLGGGNRSSKLLLDPQELTKLPGFQIVQDLAVPRV